VSTTTGFTSTSVHEEGVTNPHVRPVLWAFWNFGILAMDGHDRSVGFTDGAS
jgi:hypothetical protein